MAKRKHAAALFEVFHDNRGLDQRPSPASRAAGWWFKRRSDGDSPQAIDPNDPTTTPIKSPLIAPRIAAVEAMELKQAPAAPVAVASAPAVAVAAPSAEPSPPKTRSRLGRGLNSLINISEPAPVFQPAPAPAAVPEPQPQAQPKIQAPPVQVKLTGRFHFDHDRKEVIVRLRLAHAIVAGFGIMLIIGLAYVQGRRAATLPETASTDRAPVTTTEETPPRKVQPSALDVQRRPIQPIAVKLAPQKVIPETHAREHESGPIANSVHGLSAVNSPATPATPPPPADEKRMAGLNYVIIQSYPNQAEAIEAHNFLVKNGVACTIEKLPGWIGDASWVSVLSVRGFERDQLHTPACENLIKQIEKLSDKLGGNGSFKRFEPHLYRWK